MEKKKKKLTISISSKKIHNAPSYGQSSNKKSVVIEKKPARKWEEKKFQPRSSDYNKTKPSGNLFQKKPPINRNFDIRKMAEERATKRFKNLKEGTLQTKKGGLSKDRNFPAKREKKITLSKA